MSTESESPHLLSLITQLYQGYEISDIQVRSNNFIYVHTNRGILIANQFGKLNEEQVFYFANSMYDNQSVGLLDREKATTRAPLIDRLRERRVVDFSCEKGVVGAPARMRVQIHLSEYGIGVTCRVLRNEIATMETLGLDTMIIDSLKDLSQRRFGLGLVTGPTGSGKSTTLAALLDWLRRNFQKHIVTIEDPIEYRYDIDMEDPNGLNGERIQAPTLITQQEVGIHTMSYQSGLKEVLRKTPNVILIGEIRDRETMETCIEAAQTGHFVMSTLHTRGAVKTIDRIMEFFPREQHPGVLNRLSETLTFVLSQGLITGFNGRVLVAEYLQNTCDATMAGIRSYDGNATSLADALRQRGNVRWNANMMELYRNGLIAEEIFRVNLIAGDM